MLLKHIQSLFLFLFLLLSSCTTIQQRFTWDFFPVRYSIDTLSPLQTKPGTSYRKIEVKGSEEIYRRFTQLWFSGAYRTIFEDLHPVILASSQDIELILYFMRSVVRVFYIDFEEPPTLPRHNIHNSLQQVIQCTPLTNNELTFMLNFTNNEQLSRKNLHILLILIHELLHQQGAKPVVPKVVSPVLRQKLSMSALLPPEAINIYSKRFSSSIENTTTTLSSGLLFCRKN